MIRSVSAPPSQTVVDTVFQQGEQTVVDTVFEQGQHISTQSCEPAISTVRRVIMRCEVKLYVAGKVFTEEVIATDYQGI